MGSTNRWLAETGGTRGPAYARRFRELAASGADLHGEARTIDALVRGLDDGPGRVLDAGCGTGRVAVELARLGHDVTGVDLDASMLAEARTAADEAGVQLDLRLADLSAPDDLADLPPFDLVAAPGSVMVYLTPGTEAAVVAALAGRLRPKGLLVVGFALGRHVAVDEYDDWCAAAQLTGVHRWATWDGEPLVDSGDYAVLVHRR